MFFYEFFWIFMNSLIFQIKHFPDNFPTVNMTVFRYMKTLKYADKGLYNIYS